MIFERGRWSVLALVLALGLLTGCSGRDESGGSTAVDSQPEQHDSVEGDSNEGSGGSERSGGEDASEDNRARPPLEKRSIIRTGSMSLRTPRPERTADRVEQLIDGTAGHVGERTKDRYPGDDSARVELTLRIPTERFDTVRESVAELGKVTEDKHEAEDVTDQVVDIEARVENQERSIERLRRLMSEAENVDDVVRVESELQERESDLESLQARQKSLSDQVALSTLTVALTEPPDKPSDDEQELGFLAGLRGGYGALLTVGSMTLTALGAIAPFLPVLLVLGVAAWWMRSWLRGRLVRQPSTDPGAET